jgi:hypothetical protein
MRALRSRILIAACLIPASAAAQPALTLLESYGRVTTLVNYMTVHVAELLLACAEKNIVAEEQADARYQAYRKRNSALLERAEAWSRDAERRLQAQGDGPAAQRLREESGLTAMAAASMHAQSRIGGARDVREACTARLAAIESGVYDLAGNAEFVGLLK